MPVDDPPNVDLSDRDLRSLAMELAMQLPRNERDAHYVIELMRVGYDFFLCNAGKAEKKVEAFRPKIAR